MKRFAKMHAKSEFKHTILFSFFDFCFLLVMSVLLFFFFSSRRRHTRSKRDWSSDVCSSDLDPGPKQRRHEGRARGVPQGAPVDEAGGRSRSEERRVGKECRARWAPDQ